MGLCLSRNVIALHLDNGTTKTYLCNQGGTVSFLSRLAYHILHMTNKHCKGIIQCIPTHLNVEADYLS